MYGRALAQSFDFWIVLVHSIDDKGFMFVERNNNRILKINIFYAFF